MSKGEAIVAKASNSHPRPKLRAVSSSDRVSEPHTHSGSRFVGARFDLLLLLPLMLFILFFNLNGASFHHVDETSHVRVTQEMVHYGDLFTPRVFGEVYYNKPPFKMWLNIIPVTLFGESNFSYRFLDGLCGFATTVLIYFFSRRLFGSRIAGISSVVFLLSARSFLFIHGTRTATQDSMLVFLITVAMICGWNFIEEVRADQPLRKRLYRLAIGGGIAIGCGILTKNVAALLPLGFIGVFALLAGDLPALFRKAKAPLAALVATSLIIPALYLVPRCIMDPTTYQIMFQHEVGNRVMEGFHHKASFWYYFKKLWWHRAAVAPELLVSGCAIAILLWLKRRDRSALFVLLWAALPVLIFTPIPSRLTWYMAPGYPGMALLGGLAFATVFAAFQEELKKVRGRRALPREVATGVLTAALLGVYVYATYINFDYVVTEIVTPKNERITFDKLVGEIQNAAHVRGEENAELVVFGEPDWGRNEKVYRDMLPALIVAPNVKEAREKVASAEYLLAPLTKLKSAIALRRFTGYRLLPPVNHRLTWSVMFTYVPLSPETLFYKVEREFDFGPGKIETLYGLGDPGRIAGMTVVPMKGAKSSFVLEGDALMNSLESTLRMNISVPPELSHHSFAVSISLNDEPLGTLQSLRGGFRTYSLPVPTGRWFAGKNVVTIKIVSNDGLELHSSDPSLLLNWAKIRFESAGEKDVSVETARTTNSETAANNAELSTSAQTSSSAKPAVEKAGEKSGGKKPSAGMPLERASSAPGAVKQKK